MTSSALVPAVVETSDRLAVLHGLAEAAEEVRAGGPRSAATRRAYAVQWRHFSEWCACHDFEPLPALPGVLVCYFAARAKEGRSVSTLDQAAAAIAKMHADAGQENPVAHPKVKGILECARRRNGKAQRRATAVTIPMLRSLARMLGDDLATHRDRCLLLLGFGMGARRSELVGLDVSDVTETDDGLRVMIRKSKTDQCAQGREVGVPFGSDKLTCPVRAWRTWLESSRIAEGPAFLGVRHGKLGKRLSGDDVARILKRRADQAGIPSKLLSGHSLRAGLVTSAVLAGKSPVTIMKQTGHRSVAMLERYTRAATLFTDNCAAGIGL
jgi:integrase